MIEAMVGHSMRRTLSKGFPLHLFLRSHPDLPCPDQLRHRPLLGRQANMAAMFPRKLSSHGAADVLLGNGLETAPNRRTAAENI